jgi:undecaprenyl-diphosphatase
MTTVGVTWRWVRRFEARVLVGLALAAGALWAFLKLGGEMAEGETQAFDRRIILLFRVPGHPDDPIGSRSVQEAVRDITAVGGTTLVTFVTLIAVLTFLFHGKRRHAAVMGLGVWASSFSSELAKVFYHRPRPDLVSHMAYAYSGSFPSGHSTLSAAAYLILAVLVASLEPRRRTKAMAFGVAALVLVSVGLSRIYLGVHWPSDVIAGWCLGGLWALLAWLALRAVGGQVRGA